MLLFYYLKFCAAKFNRTSSHISDRRSLPMFLFKNGSLPLIKMASLNDLARFYSFPTMLELSAVVL